MALTISQKQAILVAVETYGREAVQLPDGSPGTRQQLNPFWLVDLLLLPRAQFLAAVKQRLQVQRDDIATALVGLDADRQQRQDALTQRAAELDTLLGPDLA